MKVSELTKEEVAALDDAAKEKIIFCDLTDDGGNGEFAILLGGRFAFLGERCRAAAELYHAGRVKYIIPSGGVAWDYEGGKITEAEYMQKMLLESGVPGEAIVLENEATTTKENMIYASLQMNRKMKLHQLHKAYIVTSQSHMRRSIRFARIYLPSIMEVAPYAAKDGIDAKDVWYKTETGRQRAERELMLIKDQIDIGILEDIEI